MASACAAGDEDAGATTTEAPASPTTTVAEPSTTVAQGVPTTTPSETDIVISGFAFSGVSSVPAGSTVSVVNQDSIGHTWTVTDLFDSGTLSQGDTFEFTFDEAGEYEYYCVIHPTQMNGTLTVEG